MRTFLRELSMGLVLGVGLLACQSTPPKDAPSGEGPGGSDEAPPDETPLECHIRSPWNGAPLTTCSARAAQCIATAKTPSAAGACIEAEASCAGCFSDVVVGCLVGSAGKPGPCGEAGGCVDGCVAKICGDEASESCRREAIASGDCKATSDELQTCLESANQTPCMERFRRECLPKVSCGNGIVEKGERCDGNCPTSCPPPPPDDRCTRNTLEGSSLTCSAICEAEPLCPASCPYNTAAVSAVGVIASGGPLPKATRAAWPKLSELKAVGCPSLLLSDSQVVLWKAPSAGKYTFSATCSATWTEYERGTGRVLTSKLQCVRRAALAHGKQCAAGVAPFVCSLDVDNRYEQAQLADKRALDPIALAAGDELLVAVDFGLAYVPPADSEYAYGGSITATSWSVSATPCAPQCSGKTCGSDGCGGSCGTCGPDQFCNASSNCQQTCVPQCAGKTCGSNGCGGSCGTCAGGDVCNASGQCVAPCVPQCAGKSCGSNGCGGSCGVCTGRRTCNASSQCAMSGPCDPVTNVGCNGGNECITLSNETNQCVLMGTGGQGDPCTNSAGCRGGYGCFAGSCRKICDRATSEGCAFGEVCAPVGGWFTLGACAPI